MGDHTDQTGGRVLPMAIDLGTTVEGERGGDAVVLRSPWDGTEAVGAARRPRTRPIVEPAWARYVGSGRGRAAPGGRLRGHGRHRRCPSAPGCRRPPPSRWPWRSPWGSTGPALELAQLGQRAEQAATGVPCGIMDQLASAAGVAGHALRIDCHSRTVDPAPLPEDLDVVVAHSGVERTLAATPYAERVADAARPPRQVVGPLRVGGTRGPATRCTDPVLRRRARHVVTENARVDALVAALGGGRPGRGRPSSARPATPSLRDDLEVSVPALDDLVAARSRPRPACSAPALTGRASAAAWWRWSSGARALPEGLRAWRVRPPAGATCGGGGRPSWPGTRPR